jgi:hypothetical protein
MGHDSSPRAKKSLVPAIIETELYSNKSQFLNSVEIFKIKHQPPPQSAENGETARILQKQN